MAASDQTVRDVMQIVRRHVDEETLRKILSELLSVPGNKSFRDTIRKMHNNPNPRGED